MKLKKETLILIVCFLVFPFITYIYLKKGINLRSKGLVELHIQKTSPDMPDSSIFNSDSLKGHVTLFIQNDSLKAGLIKELLETIYKQNENTSNLKVIVGVASTQDSLGVPAYFYLHFLRLIQSTQTREFLTLIADRDSLSVHGSATGCNALIIDKNSKIRKLYDLNDIQQVRMLIRHAAILTPDNEKVGPELVRQKERG